MPREARGAFAIAVPCLVGVWALGGLYLSLGPSLAAQQLHSQNLLWGGVVIFLLTGVGAAASVAVRNADPAAVMLGGCVALFAGAATTFAAIATRTPAALLLDTAVAGLGFGPAFMGAYRTVVALAVPDDRAGLVAAVYTVAYLAFSIPAVIAGVATSRYGLHATALIYAAAIALLAAAAAGSFLFWRGGSAGRPALCHRQSGPAARALHHPTVRAPHRARSPEQQLTARALGATRADRDPDRTALGADGACSRPGGLSGVLVETLPILGIRAEAKNAALACSGVASGPGGPP